MNTNRIKSQADMIANRERALWWIETYGEQITGKRDDAQAVVKIDLWFAEKNEGAKEAVELMEAYALLNLPAAIESARQCCINDIAIARDAIRAELEA